MGLDVNALKNRLNELNGRTKKTEAAGKWKPSDEHDVRLLPYPHGDESFNPLFFHNEIGDNMPIWCPLKNAGQDCAICAFADKLKAWKDPATGKDKPKQVSRADFEIFKRIQAKPRIVVAMVERGHESEGGKLWSMTEAQANQVVEICTEGERLEMIGLKPDDTSQALEIVLGLEKGFDLHVSYKKPGEKGNKKVAKDGRGITDIEIKPKMKVSPLAATQEEREKILKSVKKLDEVFLPQTSQEVDRLYRAWTKQVEAPNSPEEGTEKYAGAKPNTAEDAKTVGKRSVDDALNDLLGE